MLWGIVWTSLRMIPSPRTRKKCFTKKSEFVLFPWFECTVPPNFSSFKLSSFRKRQFSKFNHFHTNLHPPLRNPPPAKNQTRFLTSFRPNRAFRFSEVWWATALAFVLTTLTWVLAWIVQPRWKLRYISCGLQPWVTPRMPWREFHLWEKTFQMVHEPNNFKVQNFGMNAGQMLGK